MIVLILIAILLIIHNREVQRDQTLWTLYSKQLELKNQRILLVGLNLVSSRLHLGIETRGMETNRFLFKYG